MFAVQVQHCAQRLQHDHGRLGFGQPMVGYAIVELAARTIFEHQVDPRLVLEQLVQLDDVRMVNRLKDQYLLFQALFPNDAALLRDALDRSDGSRGLHGRLRDCAEGAGADLVPDLVRLLELSRIVDVDHLALRNVPAIHAARQPHEILLGGLHLLLPLTALGLDAALGAEAIVPRVRRGRRHVRKLWRRELRVFLLPEGPAEGQGRHVEANAGEQSCVNRLHERLLRCRRFALHRRPCASRREAGRTDNQCLRRNLASLRRDLRKRTVLALGAHFPRHSRQASILLLGRTFALGAVATYPRRPAEFKQHGSRAGLSRGATVGLPSVQLASMGGRSFPR
mmetsp:Transcript_54321/g.156181  ORF Transcript_54321/g.156181 Transcript_54321/m.156181 type:complete len:339 (+) Transcript_54321:1571-2587(+)